MSEFPSDAPEWARILNTKLDAILETNSNAASSIDNIKEQVGPVLDSLAKSPMLRMLGVGK